MLGIMWMCEGVRMFKFPKCKMFLIVSNAIHTILSGFGQENSHGASLHRGV